MKNPLVKLAVGAIMLGLGFVVSMQAQRELIAKWAGDCEDCDDEKESWDPETKEGLDNILDANRDIASFVDEAKEAE